MIAALAVGVAGCGLVTRQFLNGFNTQVRLPARVAATRMPSLPAGPSIRPLVFSSSWVQANPPPSLGVSAAAGILIDLDSNRILWERSASTQRAPASLTKMVTAMVALDLATLSTEVMVSAAAAQQPPDAMGLQAGDVVSVKDLMYGIFLDSGNDAAEALADGIVDHDVFVKLMNRKLAQMGVTDAAFTNPTGLDQSGHHASAYDVAVIAATLYHYYPELLPIAATKEISLAASATHGPYYAYNLNKMLWTYPGAIGLKTGFTDNAGGCVVALAQRGGRHLMAVVMGSDVFFTDAGKLLDYGFTTPS